MPVEFTDNTDNVLRAFATQSNNGLRGMASNTVKVANLTAPFRHKGGLKSWNVRIQPIDMTAIQITWPAVYSAYQNRGKRYDGSHKVRRYTTPGTGKGFVDRGNTDTLINIRRFFV